MFCNWSTIEDNNNNNNNNSTICGNTHRDKKKRAYREVEFSTTKLKQ